MSAGKPPDATTPPAPRVSVVVPTYDRLPLLREAVASVRAQTFDDWELVVVDDGSTDGTAAWLRSLGDPRIRVVELPHTADLATLRNRGVHEARGRYVAFLDSDDLWTPDKLERQLAAVRGSPGARWSYTAMTRIDADGGEIHDPAIPPWQGSDGWILEDVITFRAVVDTPTLMAERALVLEVGGFDGSVGSWVTDYDLVFRLARASPAVAVPVPTTRIRIHAGAHSADRAAAHRGWAALYRAFGRQVPDARLSRICRREELRHRLSLASRLAEDGRRREALPEALAVVLRRPWWPRTWRVVLWHVLGKGLLRAAADRG